MPTNADLARIVQQDTVVIVAGRREIAEMSTEIPARPTFVAKFYGDTAQHAYRDVLVIQSENESEWRGLNSEEYAAFLRGA